MRIDRDRRAKSEDREGRPPNKIAALRLWTGNALQAALRDEQWMRNVSIDLIWSATASATASAVRRYRSFDIPIVRYRLLGITSPVDDKPHVTSDRTSIQSIVEVMHIYIGPHTRSASFTLLLRGHHSNHALIREEQKAHTLHPLHSTTTTTPTTTTTLQGRHLTAGLLVVLQHGLPVVVRGRRPFLLGRGGEGHVNEGLYGRDQAPLQLLDLSVCGVLW